MGTILLIAAKDLKNRLRDRSFFIMAILAPLVLAFVLSSVGGDAFSGESFAPSYVVVDATGQFGAGLVQTLAEAGLEDVILVDTPALGREAVDDGTADAAIIMDEVFSAGLADTTQELEIVVYSSSDSAIARSVAESVAEAIASGVSGSRLSLTAYVASGNFPTTEVIAAASVATPLVEVNNETAGGRILDGVTFLSVGMSIFFLFFSVQGGVIEILEERRNGTFSRLLAAPVSRAAVMIGKLSSAALTGFFSIGVLVVATSFLLGADWGPVLGIVGLSVGAVVSAMGLGALVATFSKNVEQAQQFSGIVGTVMGLLGGSFFPVAQGPPALRALSKLTPHAWVMEGFSGSSGLGRASEALPAIGVLLLIGSFFGGVAYLRRNRLTGVL
jgi:ABC-2 type transport system permease protein